MNKRQVGLSKAQPVLKEKELKLKKDEKIYKQYF